MIAGDESSRLAVEITAYHDPIGAPGDEHPRTLVAADSVYVGVVGAWGAPDHHPRGLRNKHVGELFPRVGRSHVVHWPERVERHSTRKPEAAAVGVVGKRILRPMMDVKHIARTPVPGRVRKLILDFFTPHRGPGVKADKRGEINDERCGNHGSEGKCEPCGKTSGDCRDALRGQEEQERDDEEDRARDERNTSPRGPARTRALQVRGVGRV